MAIKKYVDRDSQREFYQVRVVRKSVTHPGVRVQKRAFKVATEAEAKKIEKSFLHQAERELMQAEQKGCTWSSLVNDWALAVETKDIFAKDISMSTVSDYVEVIRRYTTEWDTLSVSEIDKARAWLVLDRVDREVSIARRKRLRTAIDAVFSWGMLAGRVKGLSEIPTEGYKSNKKEEEKMPEILNLSEIRILLSYAKRIDHLWYPIWSLALFTGMRSGELFALEWASVDFENKMIYVHQNWTSKNGFGPTKGRYWRAVPIGPQVMQFLKELRIKRANEKYVLHHFQSWKDGRQADILREFCVGSGLPSVKFHTLRACFATQLIKDGVAPAVVMKIAGWKDLKTMQRYIRLAGIEVKGATDGLKLLPEEEVMGRVVNLFQDQ